MASQFTNYLEKKLLDHLFNKASYTIPTIYVGLSSTTPTAAGTNFTEPTTGGYARKSTAAGDWNAATVATTEQVTNANAITFATASGSWGSALTYFGLFDNSTGGNLLAWGLLNSSVTVGTGDIVSFLANGITVTST